MLREGQRPLRVGAQIGRVHQESFGGILGQVVGQDAFDHVAVFELQAYPKAFGARAGGEGLPKHQVGVGKLADKVDGLDVAQVDGDYVAG